MKKLNALIALFMMAVVPVTQAHAQVVTVESAIDQLNYALSVQWDQKDQVFRKEAVDQFAAQLNQLQKDGVSSDKIMTVLMAKMPDSQTAKDVQSLAKMAKERNLSASETNKMVMEYVQKSQTTGASWSDSATVAVIVVSVLLITTIILLSANSHGGGSTYVDYGPTYSNCYYDSYGYYYCY